MTRTTVRIGGASGFWGDSPVALPQLLRNDPLGKGMAQIVLSMPVRIPARLVPAGTTEGATP